MVLVTSHYYTSIGDYELAKMGFEEILSKDPLAFEAYHGLVMATAQSKFEELDNLMKRIENANDRMKGIKNAMEKCEKEKI
ncbi:hypothetical protein GIB67_014239 [Kingdonia uniflora]|uniref:Tetratricopeptide repeat protein n=1 Tax=Kingdonia uniflora TaxID=39325 RepID=A0A7J7M249_9MAGN|nr:hypothetical protein GIB67_014239 [Kingdonia uniflora]